MYVQYSSRRLYYNWGSCSSIAKVIAMTVMRSDAWVAKVEVGIHLSSYKLKILFNKHIDKSIFSSYFFENGFWNFVATLIETRFIDNFEM